MKISVIVPSFNSMPYVAEAIQSALSQLREDDEIVVQDGASTDGTLETMLDLAEKDSRVKVESETDSGQSEALNRALKRATGDYVLWLNADDVITERSLDTARRELENARNGVPMVVVAGHQTLDHQGGVIATYVGRPLAHPRLMARGCYVFSGSMLIEKNLLVQVGGFSDQFNYSMDLDLMFRLLTRNPSQAVVRGPIGALRWHDASKSGSVGSKFATEAWRVRMAHLRGPGDVARSATAFLRQTIALATIPLRHSRFYSRVRGANR